MDNICYVIKKLISRQTSICGQFKELAIRPNHSHKAHSSIKKLYYTTQDV